MPGKSISFFKVFIIFLSASGSLPNIVPNIPFLIITCQIRGITADSGASGKFWETGTGFVSKQF